MNNGDKNENTRLGEIGRQSDEESSDGAQKIARADRIALTGLGVRVEILKIGIKDAKCRRLQDGAEIMVPMRELTPVPQSAPEDQPRELFPHKEKWRDPGECPSRTGG